MKVRLSPPTVSLEWLRDVFNRLGSGPFLLQGYSRASLPDAAIAQGAALSNAFSSLIYVYDSTGATAKVVAYSDGTNWLRVDDNTAV